MSIQHTDPILFNDGQLNTALRTHLDKIATEVESYEASKLLNTSPHDLYEYFVSKHHVDAPALRENDISAEQVEATWNTVRRHPDFKLPAGSRIVPAVAFKFFVPVSGDASLLKLQPNLATSNPPRAQVKDSELVFTFVSLSPDAAAMRSRLDSQLLDVNRFLASTRAQVDEHNRSVRARVVQAVDSRRKRLLDAASTQAALGYPMRTRNKMCIRDSPRPARAPHRRQARRPRQRPAAVPPAGLRAPRPPWAAASPSRRRRPWSRRWWCRPAPRCPMPSRPSSAR